MEQTDTSVSGGLRRLGNHRGIYDSSHWLGWLVARELDRRSQLRMTVIHVELLRRIPQTPQHR